MEIVLEAEFPIASPAYALCWYGGVVLAPTLLLSLETYHYSCAVQGKKVLGTEGPYVGFALLRGLKTN